MEPLLPIGRFSKMTRLSLKALRLYDERGLLPPAEVDPSSGYRYYRLSQANRAETLRMLRTLGMSLNAIDALLHDDDPAAVAAALEAHTRAVQSDLAESERRLAVLERLLRDEAPLVPSRVTVEEAPAQPVIALRQATAMPAIAQTIGESFGHLGAALESGGVVPSGLPFIVFHDVIDDDTPGDVEVCIPVAEPPVVEAPVQAYTLDGGLMAKTIHHGAYLDITPAYHVLTGWILEHGHEQAGPPREIYLNDPTTVAPGEELTEVQWPIS